MARRKVREHDAKSLICRKLGTEYRGVLITPETDLERLPNQNPWLLKEKLVAKPDQLFGGRKKHGLVLLNANYDEVRQFISERMGKEIEINGSRGALTHFLIEPFIPHQNEYFAAFISERDGDAIYFSSEGGINVEDNWDRVQRLFVPIGSSIEDADLSAIAEEARPFIKSLFNAYISLDFSYLEINPLAFSNGNPALLDAVAQVDDCAHFLHNEDWEGIQFPKPFGTHCCREEEYIKSIDENSGASLKLTVLNPKGRIWTMVAGGGASVVYADEIVERGFGNELANYGDYSGNPTADESYEYARTVLKLMTKEKNGSKVLIIGGGIANFTDITVTFRGLIKAIEEHAQELRECNVRIYVRRAGPNYKQAHDMIKEASNSLGIPVHVYGPETPMTKIVDYALEELKK